MTKSNLKQLKSKYIELIEIVPTPITEIDSQVPVSRVPVSRVPTVANSKVPSDDLPEEISDDLPEEISEDELENELSDTELFDENHSDSEYIDEIPIVNFNTASLSSAGASSGACSSSGAYSSSKCLGCLTGLKSSIDNFMEFEIYQRFHSFKTRSRNLFINQIDLMLLMMPDWTAFLAGNPAYGHYTFINRRSIDLAVFLTIDLPKPEPAEEADLIQAINGVFKPYGCRVSNCCINYLDSTTRNERYHQIYLRRPVTNQRYQLFLLALENCNNWDHYLANVEEWEIKQLTRRYLKTNLLMMLSDVESIGFSSELDSEINLSLESWTFIIDPFYRLGHPQSLVCDLAFESLSDHHIKNQYPIIRRLINLSYKVAAIEAQAEQGIWKKVFNCHSVRTI